MVHSLATEIVSMDTEAEARYRARLEERETIIQRAQHDALRLAQQAVHERDTSREEAVSIQDAALHIAKDRAISRAHETAATISVRAHEHQGEAVRHILATIKGDGS